MRELLDSVLERLTRWLSRMFFERVEVRGAENIPAGRPLLLVANHGNSLVDPMLLIAWVPVRVRFLAKSTLWKHPIIMPFVRFAGAIPVYRPQDQGSDMSRNENMFARCHEVLASGGHVAIFPEGTSHSQPDLMPLKTGAARIVLQAEERFGPLGIAILPVGLMFDARGKFRSRALVEIGKPIDPGDEIEFAASDPVAAVRRLTEKIGDSLRGIVPAYESWEERRLVERAAEIYARPASGRPAPTSLAGASDVERAFREGYETLRDRVPEQVRSVAGEVDEYDRLLEIAGVDDRHVASDFPPRQVRSFTVRTVVFLLIRLPVAIVGGILNFLPYQLIALIIRKLKLQQELLATYKVLGGMIFYPAAWLAEGWLAARWWGDPAGIAVLLLGPVTGYGTLLFRGRWQRFLGEARAYLTLRTDRRLHEELKARRKAVYSRVAELVEIYSGATS